MCGQELGHLIRVFRQVVFGFWGYHQPLDCQCHAVHLRRPGELGQEALQGRGIVQALLLDGSKTVFQVLTELAVQMGLPSQQVGCPDQGEQAWGLVPAGRGHVALRFERGGHEWAEDRLEGTGHGSMVPHDGVLAGMTPPLYRVVITKFSG